MNIELCVKRINEFENEYLLRYKLMMAGTRMCSKKLSSQPVVLDKFLNIHTVVHAVPFVFPYQLLEMSGLLASGPVTTKFS